MVKPSVNQIDRMPRDCRNARIRDDARAPNSPRDSGIGVVRAARDEPRHCIEIKGEANDVKSSFTWRGRRHGTANLRRIGLLDFACLMRNCIRDLRLIRIYRVRALDPFGRPEQRVEYFS
jgi:hypothetical protein